MPVTRHDLSLDELAALPALAGAPRYRSRQVWDGLYAQLAEIADLTSLPKALRDDLARTPELAAALTESTRQEADGGTTVKWLFGLADGAAIETVLMHYPGRSTVCVSSQAGCAMACGFCATGQAGFRRHLTAGEIVEQVVRAAREARATQRRLSNVVFMGMGEPLANFDATWAAVQRLHDDLGLSARHITISTVGIVPGIHKLARESLPVGLAVSLHAANDKLRNELVPVNKRYPLASLIAACRAYTGNRNRRLSFEWACIAGVNDRPSDADELAEIAVLLGAHVNLIPLNPTPGYLVLGSTRAAVHTFADALRERGVNATVRHTRGQSIDAACGQLANRGP
ncbi:MAG TPA: 23S rRNA (adenine(2503)-C(2))-methyltransferase RlmN [Acidimicrobiales bacterium]|nr:23S rRNA (adenine(2503)-C(2))-methyltransferase RlmN [Acidimicrobiales bacterium]